jgi:hypothetical protein
MRRLRSTLAMTAVLASLVLGLGVSPAGASPTEAPQEASASDAGVAALRQPLRIYGPVNCPYFHLCVFEDPGLRGHGLAFKYCDADPAVSDRQNYNLSAYAHPNGGNWMNRISSLENNQTAGTMSYFHDLGRPPITVPVLEQRAYGYRLDLRANFDPISGLSVDNRIDVLDVCR